MYFGRKVEPLAFSIALTSVNRQIHCPLFTLLPAEIREVLYEFAFTDCTSNPPNEDNLHRRHPPSRMPVSRHRPLCDIAVHLLRTCKAIYLEAYKLPFLLNSYIVYNFGHLPSYDVSRPRFRDLAPWQFGLIQKLDISLSQFALEKDTLAKYLKTWRAKERHQGCIVAPRFYQESRNTYPNLNITRSFNFGLIPATTPCEDGISTSHPTKSAFYPHRHPANPETPPPARAMIARPLTQQRTPCPATYATIRSRPPCRPLAKPLSSRLATDGLLRRHLGV
jgi:hypothetical protein